jgi:hypothetical protein
VTVRVTPWEQQRLPSSRQRRSGASVRTPLTALHWSAWRQRITHNHVAAFAAITLFEAAVRPQLAPAAGQPRIVQRTSTLRGPLEGDRPLLPPVGRFIGASRAGLPQGRRPTPRHGPAALLARR